MITGCFFLVVHAAPESLADGQVSLRSGTFRTIRVLFAISLSVCLEKTNEIWTFLVEVLEAGVFSVFVLHTRHIVTTFRNSDVPIDLVIAMRIPKTDSNLSLFSFSDLQKLNIDDFPVLNSFD